MRGEQYFILSVENPKVGVRAPAVAEAASGEEPVEAEESSMTGSQSRCPTRFGALFGSATRGADRATTRGRRRGPRLCLLGASLFVLISGLTLSAAADARSDYLIRLLKGSSQFRVRAQAAISLSTIKNNREAVEALSGALKDDHPAVRAAAASSLERIGDPGALGALEASRNDSERAVKAAVEKAIARLRRLAGSTQPVAAAGGAGRPALGGTARYYVGVGMPGTASNAVNRQLLENARRFIESRVSEVDGVLIAPEDESPSAARKVLASRKLVGFYLDSSIVSVETQPGGGTRAVVSVIVGTYPDRDMKMILQGAATVIGSDSRGATQAVEGAFRGALRRLPQALQTSGR